MAENSGIEWTDHTFNPWIGCTKVSPGCDNCYAETLMDKRHHRVEWGGERSRTGASTWAQPLKWQRNAKAFYAEHGRRQRVFCSSLADVFDNHRSILASWRADLAALILSTPDLEWLLLTKRIGNALDMLIDMFPNGVPDNVRVGATMVNQEEWNRDANKLAQVSVATKLKPFLSCEPLLGSIDLMEGHIRWARWVGWVIVGGESGPGARHANYFAVTSLRDQCANPEEMGSKPVPFLFKQWGAWAPIAGDMAEGDILAMDSTNFLRKGQAMRRMSKKDAGRLLDGKTYTEFPA